MKLVIDISEETYKAIMKPFSTFKEQRTHKSVITEACIAIANGKPQEPKTGYWIETAEEYYKAVNEYGGGVNEYTQYFLDDDIACSVCLAMYSVIDNETERFDFCPSCGCRMEGGAE